MSSADVARLVLGYLSDRGLEETKNAFSKESQDLLGSGLENDVKEGQKLTSIVEEYFLTKGYVKKGKSADPESVLLSLWKQFDVLVGQLKHSTIHNSAKEKNKAKRDVRNQRGLFTNDVDLIEQYREEENCSEPYEQSTRLMFIDFTGGKSSARVRELNKQNWVALQQKNKSLAATQRGIMKHGVVCGTVNTPQCSPSISTQYIHLGPYPTAPQPGHLAQNVSSTTLTKAPLWKTPTKIHHGTVGAVQSVVQSDVISQSILNSSQPLQSCNENLLPPDQFRSPKRKSAPPKKRNGETIAAVPPAQVSTKTTPITSTPTPEDSQLDIQGIVDKILGRPELPEKLAENINRAVEIDALPGQQAEFNPETKNSAQAQIAVVNSNKVDDIMEMMKSDPVFEELFSSFENFESSCEELETGQAREGNPKTSNPSNSLDNDKCANEALDALLLLANSPVRPVVPTSDLLETPQKGNTLTVLNSTTVPSTSPVPVILSPGDLDPTRRLPHVRQLNFARTGDGNTSQGAYSGDKSSSTPEVIIIPGTEIIRSNVCGEESSGINICESKQSLNESFSNKNLKCSKEKGSEVISEGEVFKEDNPRREDVIFVRSKDPQAEASSTKDVDKTNENAEVSIVDKQENFGQKKPVGNNPAVLQSEEKKSSPPGTGCEDGNANESEDIVCSSNDTTRTAEMCDTERPCGPSKTVNDSPLKLSVLEDLAVNEFLQNKIVEPTDTRPPLKAPHRVRKYPVMKTLEGCNKTSEVMLSDSKEVENISKDTSTEVSEGLTSLTEEFVSYIGGFTNIKTPESKNAPPGNDLSSSAESDKTSKRKLKRKKKSSRTSKKAKLLPDDLDVDKFLSSLHYAQEEKA